MMDSFSIVTLVLVAVPGVLIPLYVVWRMIAVLKDERRERLDRIFAGGTVIAMFVLMGVAVYAAQEISGILNNLA